MRWLLQLMAVLFSMSAFADAYDLPPVVAVQDRAYSVHKEITPHFGILPLDAFNKAMIFGASYTYGLSPQWSWEVLNASYATNISTNLKDQLINNFHVQPQGVLDQANSMYTTQILYSPLYGKYLLFNNKVVPNELNLSLSGGVIDYKYAGVVPTFGPGLVQRFYISQDSSIKFDARVLYQVTDTQSSNIILYLTIGYSIHLDSTKGGGS